MTLNADAELLLTRLRNAHRARVDAIAVRRHGAAHAAATIARDLADEASPELLRAALTRAVQPDGGQPPIPVVLGPQHPADTAYRGYAVDEVMALVRKHGSACAGFAHRQVTEAETRHVYEEVEQAVRALSQLGAAHSEGRLS